MELKHTPPAVADRGYMSGKDAQEYVGVSRDGLRRFFIKTKAPRTLKVGRRVYLCKEDIDAAVAMSERKADE